MFGVMNQWSESHKNIHVLCIRLFHHFKSIIQPPSLLILFSHLFLLAT